MGTTAEKLTYLNETKTKLKDMLNLGGASLTTEPFRQYVDTLKNRYLYFMNNGTQEVWDNWEKVVGEGTTITLNNTEEAPMKIVLKGNTSQETTTGKNMIDIPTTTYTMNNYYYRDVGTGIQITSGMVGKSYSFSYDIDISSITTTVSGVSGVVGRGTTAGGMANQIKASTFPAEVGKYHVKVENISISNEWVGQYIVVRFIGFAQPSTTTYTYSNVQFEQSTTATSYEPYTNGASPNPDYPQDIHVVSGDNTINICGRNLAYTGWAEDFASRVNNNNVAKLETKDNKNCLCYTANAGYGDYDNKYLFKTNWKENTRYTIKCSILNDASQIVNNYNMQIYYTDGTTTPIFLSNQQNAWISFSYTSAPNKTIKYITSAYYAGARWLDLDTFMVYEGTETLPYEPYQSQTYQVNLPVENYFNINATHTDISGLTYKYEYTLKPNTQYTISSNVPNTNTANVYANGTSSSTNKVCLNSPQTITSDANGYFYIAVRYTPVQSDSGTINMYQAVLDGTYYIQLEEGNKVNSYSPYGQTPIELCKIGDYQDTIVKDNGKWYLNKQIGKHTITDSDIYLISSYWYNTYGQYGAGILKSNLGLPETSTNRQSLCNMSKKIDGQSYINNNTYIFNANAKYVFFFSSDFDTKEHANEKLVGANVYFNLDTPTYTEITDSTLLSQLNALAKSYNSQTNISQENNDLPFIINATALREMS